MSQFAFDVFVSYSHQDQPLARKLVEWLRSVGFRVWIDEEQLVPGSRFRAGLQQGIRESQHLLALLTPKYSRRSWTQRELDLFDLTADHSERRVLAVQIGEAAEGPLDQVLLVHQRVCWSRDSTELDRGGLWQLYCGLKGVRPGPRSEWESKAYELAQSQPAAKTPATGSHGSKTPLVDRLTDNTSSSRLPKHAAAALVDTIDTNNDDWRSALTSLRDAMRDEGTKASLEQLLVQWWARGSAELAAAIALASLPGRPSEIAAWPFLDLGCVEIADWFLIRAAIIDQQPSEIWFSWAVAERCWNILPAAAELVPESRLKLHFVAMARKAQAADVTFAEFEQTYDYGIMITPWNHFHLSWMAVRLGDVDAAVAHVLRLCSTTTHGDVRAGRFLNRLATWKLFEAVRTRQAVADVVQEARTALGLVPSASLGALRQRLVAMWRDAKSAHTA